MHVNYSNRRAPAASAFPRHISLSQWLTVLLWANAACLFASAAAAGDGRRQAVAAAASAHGMPSCDASSRAHADVTTGDYFLDDDTDAYCCCGARVPELDE